ncbi:MAG: four-carbon acid sugar kinase family protein [Pseudomonadota bacterium]
MTSPPNPLVGILADDLTSAADGAGPFVRKGLQATVSRQHLPQSRETDVIAVDIATRSMSEHDAAARVKEITQELEGAQIVYKTVDSTLRGHVFAEVEAVIAGSQRKRLVFAPAFPDAGRITRDGFQFVDGVPVSESRYGSDPVHPARTSRLSDLVPSSVRDALLINAETQDELNAKIAVIPDPEDVVWIGSPGLAIALSQLVTSKSAQPSMPKVRSDILVVVGSTNAISSDQVGMVEEIVNVTVLRAPAERADPGETLAALTARAVSAIETGRYGAVIATGGDTMEAILNAIGVRSFDLTGEFEPGFPVGLADYKGEPLVLGLKAGGFGSPDSLRRAVDHLTGSKEYAL